MIVAAGGFFILGHVLLISITIATISSNKMTADKKLNVNIFIE